MGESSMSAERRSEPRYALIERASAVLGPDMVAQCIVADVSSKGARLGFGVEPRLPRRFELVFAKSGERAPVRLVWQAGLVAGVKFDSRPAFLTRLKGLAQFRRTKGAGLDPAR
jgi:hypothetical protein